MNESILHFRAYPLCEPTDAVKLAYQSAFGCGHLLTDDAACLSRLEAERNETPADPAMPAATPIGGGLCRLNLAAPDVRALSSARVLRMMMLTEKRVTARADNERLFRESLTALGELARSGEAPFSAAALDAYLAAYEAQGCPPVSHSAAYRTAYQPAYRVVLSDLAALLPLVLRMDARLDSCGGEAHNAGASPLTAVLDGSCGAGKTTLAALLSELYLAPVIHMDDFFLPFDLRTEERLAQAGGNIHYERFEREVLPRLPLREAFAYCRYDCATGGELPRECPAASVRIVEGSYALHPRFRPAYERMGAITAFVSVREKEQLTRLQKRSPERYERFVAEWIPMERKYFKACGVEGRAEIAIRSLPW